MKNLPPGTKEADLRLREAKELLGRLYRGHKMLEDAYKQKSLAQAFEIIEHYGRVSKELITKLEEAAILQQFCITGATTFITREGRPVGVDSFLDPSYTEADPWSLMSLQLLKETFGEDVHSFVRFADPQN